MRILAVDTSGPAVGVALLADDRLLFECTLTHKRTHSVWLMPAVEQALSQTERSVEDVDLFAAVVGPGSFTGVRIGVTTVKSLAQATGKRCVGVNALEALAVGAGEFSGVICPLLDARAGQVYAASFMPGIPPRRLMPDTACALPEYLEQIARVTPQALPMLFLGDGAPVFAEEIKKAVQRFGGSVRIAPPHLCGLRAGAAAVLARETAGSAVACDALLPLYLRAPQAEREREERHG